jgi:hypothetical protein
LIAPKAGPLSNPPSKFWKTVNRWWFFPEGKISNSGTYLPFKKGSAHIAIGAYERLQGKEKVGIVPIHICYGKRHEESAGSSYGAMGFKWRGGVTITVGQPVYNQRHPANDGQTKSQKKSAMPSSRRPVLPRTCPQTMCTKDRFKGRESG